jgi:prolyl-tRNA synthetase
MKDASFHKYADAEREYHRMAAAYRIFQRCGLNSGRWKRLRSDRRIVVARFHVLADSGEDALVSCTRCGTRRTWKGGNSTGAGFDSRESPHLARKVRTPKRTVDDVSAFLAVPADRFIKTLLFRHRRNRGGAGAVVTTD